MTNMQESEEVAAHIHRLAQGYRLLRYLEERDVVRRLPNGVHEPIPGAFDFEVSEDLEPERQDIEAAGRDGW